MKIKLTQVIGETRGLDPEIEINPNEVVELEARGSFCKLTYVDCGQRRTVFVEGTKLEIEAKLNGEEADQCSLVQYEHLRVVPMPMPLKHPEHGFTFDGVGLASVPLREADSLKLPEDRVIALEARGIYTVLQFCYFCNGKVVFP